MRIKIDLDKVRSYASEDMAVGKVELYCGNALELHRGDIHWMIVPVPVAPESRECRYVPVFFCINEKAMWLARSIAERGWPFHG